MITEIPIASEDLAAIYTLNRELILRYEDFSAVNAEKIFHWVQQSLRENERFFRKILWNGEPAGYYCLLPRSDGWEIDSLFVLPPFQNKGIATHILSKCMASPPVFLYVFRENTGALRLYQRLGFRIVRELPTRFIMAYQKQD